MSKLRNPIKNILNQTFPDREQKREDSFRGEAGAAAGGGGGQTAEFQLKYRPHYSHGNFPTFFKRGSWQGPGVRTNGECRRKQGPRADCVGQRESNYLFLDSLNHQLQINLLTKQWQ